MIHIAADHRGYSLKEGLKSRLLSDGYEVSDAGALKLDINDDYPDFAISAVEAMLREGGKFAKAILVCGSGHGMDMLANKYKGVRSALCFNIRVARQSREHEDANVLVLPADWVKEHDALEIVKTWLETPFSDDERHTRRLGKVKEIEDKNFK